jgi:hypothetical protein
MDPTYFHFQVQAQPVVERVTERVVEQAGGASTVALIVALVFAGAAMILAVMSSLRAEREAEDLHARIDRLQRRVGELEDWRGLVPPVVNQHAGLIADHQGQLWDVRVRVGKLEDRLVPPPAANEELIRVNPGKL